MGGEETLLISKEADAEFEPENENGGVWNSHGIKGSWWGEEIKSKMGLKRSVGGRSESQKGAVAESAE